MPAVSVNTQPPLSREELLTQQERKQALLRRLDAAEDAVRQQAIEECRSLPAHEINGLLNSATQPELREAFPPELTFGLSVCPLGLGCVMLLFAETCRERGDILGVMTLVVIAGIFFLIPAIMVLPKMLLAKTQRLSPQVWESLAEILISAEDPQMLAEVMRLLHTWEYKGVSYCHFFPLRMKQVLYTTAAHWLEALDMQTIRDMTIQHPGLLLFLRPARVKAFPHASIRILAYLEQYGTSSVLPYVAFLANGGPFAASNRDVRAAAKSCLSALKQRVHANALPNTLLRAGAAPTDTHAPLLRPAMENNSDCAPAQLLRISSEPASEENSRVTDIAVSSQTANRVHYTKLSQT